MRHRRQKTDTNDTHIRCYTRTLWSAQLLCWTSMEVRKKHCVVLCQLAPGAQQMLLTNVCVCVVCQQPPSHHLPPATNYQRTQWLVPGLHQTCATLVCCSCHWLAQQGHIPRTLCVCVCEGSVGWFNFHQALRNCPPRTGIKLCNVHLVIFTKVASNCCTTSHLEDNHESTQESKPTAIINAARYDQSGTK